MSASNYCYVMGCNLVVPHTHEADGSISLTNIAPKMTNPKPMSVEVENGKYTFTVSPAGEVAVLRHGEPWMNIDKCAKAMIALIYSLDEARAERDEATESNRNNVAIAQHECEALQKRIETFEESSAEQARCINAWAERYDKLKASTIDIQEHHRRTMLFRDTIEHNEAQRNKLQSDLQAEREAHEKMKVELARREAWWSAKCDEHASNAGRAIDLNDSLRKQLEEARALPNPYEVAKLVSENEELLGDNERLKAENERLASLLCECEHYSRCRPGCDCRCHEKDEVTNLREKPAAAESERDEYQAAWKQMVALAQQIRRRERARILAAEYECEVRGETILKREREAVLIRQQERQRAAKIVRHWPVSGLELLAREILADDPVEEKAEGQ